MPLDDLIAEAQRQIQIYLLLGNYDHCTVSVRSLPAQPS